MKPSQARRRKTSDMKCFFYLLVSALGPGIGSGQLLKRQIDSIRIYYASITYKNLTVVSADDLKAFPIAKTRLISDRTTLSLIEKSINHLVPGANKRKYFDTRVLCEIYFGKKIKRLSIDTQKLYLWRSKVYDQSEELFRRLYPE